MPRHKSPGMLALPLNLQSEDRNIPNQIKAQTGIEVWNRHLFSRTPPAAPGALDRVMLRHNQFYIRKSSHLLNPGHI